jgi:SAM-dependent methyltransferase
VRAAALTAHLARLLPYGARVLDVGCGDGRIAGGVMQRRPDLHIRGIDVLLRPGAAIPVEPFDGQRLPYAEGAFDCVSFVDVLHHTDDPSRLLREAARVSRGAILVKDHLCDSRSARARLRFMDWVGNARHGVALPYNYWSKRKWQEVLSRMEFQVNAWEEALGLYPAWADWCFGDGLHFLALLTRSAAPRPG